MSSFLLIQQNRRITVVCYSSHGHLPFLSNCKRGENWDCSTGAAEEEIHRLRQSQHFHTRNISVYPKPPLKPAARVTKIKLCNWVLCLREKKKPHTITSCTALHTHIHAVLQCQFYGQCQLCTCLAARQQDHGLQRKILHALTHTERKQRYGSEIPL